MYIDHLSVIDDEKIKSNHLKKKKKNPKEQNRLKSDLTLDVVASLFIFYPKQRSIRSVTCVRICCPESLFDNFYDIAMAHLCMVSIN